MTIEYKQLAQTREAGTSAVSIYSPSSGEEVQIFLKICNNSGSNCEVCVYHDDDGTTYDESTAIVFGMDLEPGQVLEIDKIFMSDSDGNLAYKTETGNALTATVYGVVKS